MHRFIREINKNETIIDIFENMDRTITAKGEFWLVYDEYILNNEQVKQICNNRITALVKLLPGSANLELRYLQDSLKSWKCLLEAI